ncbi:MAG TPA: ribokinase [Nitrososphaera sp.]|nr:ribokinase [Nitrososphaera sp.]
MPSLLVCGAINWDTTIFVNSLPRPGEELKVKKVISVPGGKGANTAVAAARILGKNNEVGIIGMLGPDSIAEMQITTLREEGIDLTLLSRHEELSSGQAYVIVDDKGENMILTHRAANAGLTKEFAQSEKVSISIDKAKMLILIDPPLEVAVELASSARKRGKTVVLSPATLVHQGVSSLGRLLDYSDYIILNEHEAESLASAESGIAACEKLSTMLNNKPVITTLGAEGCIACHAGGKTIIPTMDLAQFGLRVASTVGAGDTLEGAFASFKLKGSSDLEALLLANIAASLKITREHTRGSPTHDEIQSYAHSDAMRPAFDRLRVTSGHQGPAG